MIKSISKLRFILTKGPASFVLTYALIILSPLVLIRALGLEGGSINKELAAACGIIALMLLLSTFWLSGRFTWINGKRGIDLTLKFHRRIVIVAMVLSILHIVTALSSSMPDSFIFSIVLLLLIISQIVMANIKSKVNIPYEYWRLIHGIVAAILVALLSWHAITEGNYSISPIVATFWAVCTLVSITSLFYVHIYVPFRQAKYPYTVVNIEEAANDQWQITIEPQGFTAMNFEAGQYAFVSFGQHPFSDRAHPFSFSSCPSDRPQISFTIKKVGDFTNTIDQITLGSKVFLYGPYGHLKLSGNRSTNTDSKGVVLFAGGIGITPMISILREMHAKNDPKMVKLFYACRDQSALLYQAELMELSNQLNLELTIILSQPKGSWMGETGRINQAYLQQKICFEGFEDCLYFTCGTTSFVNSVVYGLEQIEEISMFNIMFEDFSVYS